MLMISGLLLILSASGILTPAFYVELIRPLWLLAAMTTALPILLLVRAKRRGLPGGVFSTACQCLAIILAAVALAGPTLPRADQARKSWLILRDASGSLRGQGEVQIFDDNDRPVITQRFAKNLPAKNQRADESATNISSVLRLAASRAKAGKLSAVTLLTDGRFSDDWQGSAQVLGETLANAGVPLRIIPLDSPPKDARIVDFKIFPHQSKVNIRTSVQANSVLLRRLTIRRTKPDPAVLYDQNLRLEPHLPVTIRLIDDGITAEEYASWRAKLSPADVFPENDAMSVSLLPRSSRAVAIAPANATLPGELSKLSPADAPKTPAGWSKYSTVVLADRTGELLTKPQRKALADYVRQGGGLVLIGTGPSDSPADLQDPLNNIAALLANPFARKPIDLIVVLDASGSMARPGDLAEKSIGQNRFNIAAEATISLREHLTAHDRLKVITFADQAKIIYNSHQAGPNFATLRDALDTVRPSGPTIIGPALKMVTNSRPGEKRIGLVLVLSDLRTSPFEANKIAERFKAQSWSLAVVATGPTADEPTHLRHLATKLDAPLVSREHLHGLAKIFGKFCRQARGEIFKHGQFTIRAEPSWENLSALGSVRTYAPAALAQGAEVLGAVQPGGDPLLAYRQVALGRIFSLVAPMGADNPQWTAGPGLGNWRALINKLIALSARPAIDGRFTVDISAMPAGKNRSSGQALRVHVIASQDGASINGLVLRVEVFQLDSTSLHRATEKIPAYEFHQISPGEYVVTLPTMATLQTTQRSHATQPAGLIAPARLIAPAGLVGLRILSFDNTGEPETIVWQGLAGENAQTEFANLGADYNNLRRLAELTGGRLEPSHIEGEKLSHPADDNHNDVIVKSTTTPAWPWFLAAGILLMLLGWYKENRAG